MAYKAKTSPGKSPEQSFLDTALHRFKLSRETFSAQRRREAEDEAFAAGEQWDSRTKQARAGNPNNGAANEDNLGAKPCLTISLLDQPMQQTINAFDDAEISVQFSADDGEANEATADTLNDLYRQIEAKSGANAARAWAFERGAKSGMGWYRIVSEYESDDSFDQCLRIKRILNQSSVYPDPWAQEPDFSDGTFLFQTQDLPYSEFKKQYPNSKIDGIDSKEYSDATNPVFGWIKTTETGERIIRIAEYFYVEKTPRKMTSGSLTREAFTRQLKWAKMTAADVLEQQDLDGKWIPYVPAIGKEHNLSGQRLWTGLIAPAKDAQRGFNVMWSELVSSVGISSKAPWLAAVGQTEDFLDEWQTANVRNWALLRYKPVDVSGAPAPPPQRQTSEPPIQALTQACEMSRMNVQMTTGFNAPSLGALDPQSRSGKAIVELKKQAEQGSGYVASFCSISVPCEARIILDLIPHVYDRQGRTLHLKSNAGKARKVTLGEAQQGSDQPIDFSKGAYGVEVTVSKAFATRRQQAAEAMSQLIQAAPEMMLPTIGDLYFKNSDFAEHRALQERMEAVLDPRVLQAMKMSTEMPPQARAQMTQLATMLQQTQAQLQQAGQIIATKQVEKQADLQKAQMDNATKLQIAELQALVTLAGVEQKVDAENARTMVEAEAEGISKKLELVKNMQELLAKHRAESDQQSHQQSHDAGLAAMQHHHDQQMAHLEHTHAKELADQAARHATDQAVLQASIAPSPQADGSGD